MREIGNANENLEDQEKNGSTQSRDLQLKTRLENIVRRPNKPGSKVRLYYDIIAWRPPGLERFGFEIWILL